MRSHSAFILCLLFLAGSCTPGKKSAGDRTEMQVAEDPYKLDFAGLREQKIYTLSERAGIIKEGNRGVLTAMSGGLISLATNAVKKMIKKDRSKYTAEYTIGQRDLFFYDQLSRERAFDPVGMKFNGFTVLRLLPGQGEQEDTAMLAEFELDDSNLYEILNNSTFRLKLKEFQLNTPRAKVEKKGPRTLNLDMEITLTSSYVSEQGVLFDNIVIGKFYLFLRNAPVDKSTPGYTAYYEKLKGKMLEGRSFIVPRSLGSSVSPEGGTVKSYSQGGYAISVRVRESSKNSFVTTLLMDNSDKIIESAGTNLKKLIR